MLGSLHDAEDALQDALLRAWRGLPRFDGRSSLRAWLYKIATNTTLRRDRAAPEARAADRPRPAPRTPTTALGEPLAESVWVEPYPDDAGIEDGLAGARRPLRAARERRAGVRRRAAAPARHAARRAHPARGARVLRARGRRARWTPPWPSVNSALQRARRAVDERLPEQSQQATLRALGDDELRGAGRALHRGDGRRATSTASSRCSPRTPPGRCRRWRAGSAAARRARLPRAGPALGPLPLAPRARRRQRPGRRRVLHLARGRGTRSCPSRSTS